MYLGESGQLQSVDYIVCRNCIVLPGYKYPMTRLKSFNLSQKALSQYYTLFSLRCSTYNVVEMQRPCCKYHYYLHNNDNESRSVDALFVGKLRNCFNLDSHLQHCKTVQRQFRITCRRKWMVTCQLQKEDKAKCCNDRQKRMVSYKIPSMHNNKENVVERS